MCGGDGSRHLSFKLAYKADTEKCPSRDVEVREGFQSQTSWFCMHQSLLGVSGPSELELTTLQREFGEFKGI